MGRIELFLWKLRDEHAQPVKLRRSDESAEQPVEVFCVQHFSLRDIAELGMGREENRRGKFRQQALRQVEVQVKPLESWKLFDLDLRKYLAPDGVLDMRESVKTRGKHPLLL